MQELFDTKYLPSINPVRAYIAQRNFVIWTHSPVHVLGAVRWNFRHCPQPQRMFSHATQPLAGHVITTRQPTDMPRNKRRPGAHDKGGFTFDKPRRSVATGFHGPSSASCTAFRGCFALLPGRFRLFKLWGWHSIAPSTAHSIMAGSVEAAVTPLNERLVGGESAIGSVETG